MLFWILGNAFLFYKFPSSAFKLQETPEMNFSAYFAEPGQLTVILQTSGGVTHTNLEGPPLLHGEKLVLFITVKLATA